MGIPAPLGVGALGTPAGGDMANAVVSGKFTAVGPGLPFAFYGPFNLFIYPSISTTLATTAGSLAATVGSATGIVAGQSINSPNVPAGTTVGSISSTTVTLAPPPLSQIGSVSPSSDRISGLSFTAGLIGSAVTGPDIPAGTTVLAITTPASDGVPGVLQISAAPTGVNTAEPLLFVPTGNIITKTGTDPAAVFTGAALTFSGTVQLERSFDGGSTWIVCGVGGAGAQAIFTAGTAISVVAGEPEKGMLYRVTCPVYSSGTINYRMSATGAAALSLSVATPI